MGCELTARYVVESAFPAGRNCLQERKNVIKGHIVFA